VKPIWITSRLINDAKPSPATWIVEDHIPANTVTLINSVSGSGKSILALHLSLCLLAGRDWLGLKCQQSGVAYWDQDNPDSWLTDNRIYAIRRGLGLADDLPEAFTFRANKRILGNDARLLEMTTWLKETGAKVLVVDTLASVNPYGENDSNAMASAIVDNFFPLVDAGITPIILHHIGKDFVDSKGTPRRRTGIHAARGSSALVAAVGTSFNLDREGERRSLTCVKPRYGFPPAIPIDYDEDGYLGSDDWKITITSPRIKVYQEFLVQFIKENGLERTSCRKLVDILRDRGYSTSQMSASRALNRTK
jgi:hypothetical protein